MLADEARWMRLIVALQRGVAPDALGDADLTITEIGAAARLDEVIEQAGEGDEQNADDGD